MEVHAGREAAVDKEIEIISTTDAVSITLEEATSNLAENLAQSGTFLRFKAAENRMNADQEALRLMTELSELQQKVRTQQYSGNIAENDLNRLRGLQSAVGANETIQQYGIAQEEAIAFLREVNQEITQLLGIDFAALIRRAGSC